MQISKSVGAKDIPSLVLRTAELGDIEDILHAQLTTFPDDPKNLVEEEFAKAIPGREHRLMVAIYESKFAGYVIVSNRPYRPWSSLDNLIVLPEFSRKGIGRRLLDEALKPLQRRPILRLFVEKNNHRAIGLYRKTGFLHLQTRKGNYENGDDALILYKFLWSTASDPAEQSSSERHAA